MALYIRQSALNYALTYAAIPNPNYKYFKGNDCTNFVSQCLRAGGAKNYFHRTHPWWYLQGKSSISWSVAGSLYWYIRVCTQENISGIRAQTFFKSTNQPLSNEILSVIEIGDLIQYRNTEGQVQHSAIITGFENTNQGAQPLISQHTSNQKNIPWRKTFPIAVFHHITNIN